MSTILTRMTHLTVASAMLCACSGSPAAPTGPSQAVPASTNAKTAAAAVAIEDYSFQPATLRVKEGTTVTFTNHDVVEHTVTAVSATFGSPFLKKNHSWKYTFTKTGAQKYYCRVHPYMHGEIIVTK
jgi:plastocyanin